MATLMGTTLLLLNKNEEVTKRIPPKDLIELFETQELRSNDQLEGTLLAKDYMADFDDAKYVGVEIKDTREYHIYALTSWKVNNDHQITFSGIDEAHFELDADGFIQDRRFVMNDFAKVIHPIFEDSRWEIRSIPTEIPVGTINFYFVSRLAALKDVIDTFDVDVGFSYVIENNQITHRYVDFFNSMGKDSGKRFAYGSNLLSVVKETSTTDLYTAVVPRGDGIAKQDEDGNDTGGYSRKINIADEVWSKAKGDPVDKPQGQLYLEIPERTAQFGYPTGRPKVLIKDYDGIKDTTDLIRQAYLDLKDISRPKVQFTSDVINLGTVSLGDAITIIMPQYQIEYKTRIFKLKIDLVTNTRSVAEFGDYVVKTAGQRAYDMWLKQKKQQDNQDDVNQGLSNTIDQNKDDQDEINQNQDQINQDTTDKIDQNQEIQDTINQQLEAADQEAQKLIEQWQQQLTDQINQAQQDIGDYIQGQDQLGEIIFTGKNMLPTRGNIYNIVARTSLDSGKGQLIFNSNGLGYYDGNRLVKTAVTNDGRVYADAITGNQITGLTINSGTLKSGQISAAKIDGSYITGGTIYGTNISGGTVTGVKIQGGTISGNTTIALGGTRITSYGISVPELTVTGEINGVQAIGVSDHMYLGQKQLTWDGYYLYYGDHQIAFSEN
ncbi:phage tail protein [Bombilactobacillus folatiphilus]|uniref:Phage tail protein n=1 Tax=Bombilactobacillus folatiphilus TaxID=2923362 RepID=A0ABY4PAS0_9LACO|nr:phage tail spike protein [Bombilactobacillus folatiphilus]UQS82611.1 phage tail protein [Bombilactobacillus folatiphilus]